MAARPTILGRSMASATGSMQEEGEQHADCEQHGACRFGQASWIERWGESRQGPAYPTGRSLCPDPADSGLNKLVAVT